MAAEAVAGTRAKYAQGALEATELRGQASTGTTIAAAGVGSVWAASAGLSAASLATAGAVGAVAIPPLAPALLGVMIATIFIMRQKGLNKELLSNLYFIKMEVERMARIHAVMKDIASENRINLNTASLAMCMAALQKKIMQFADKQTTQDIEQLESFLKQGSLDAAKAFVESADSQGEAAAAQLTTTKQGHSWSISGWSRRWLSPDETLRQIIRDITIASIWFSIMLGEFDLFMRYTGASGTQWKNGVAMKDLLIANRQLGLTGKNTTNFDEFYKSIGDMKAAVGSVGLTIREVNEDPTAGGRRTTYKRAKRSRRHSSNAAAKTYKKARQKYRRTP